MIRNYKGKDIKEGNWVYGDYYEYQGVSYITNEHLSPPSAQDPLGDWEVNNYEVDPKTVCQFTGSITHNDEKIYEDDITKIELPLGGFWGNIKQEKIGVVKFNEELGSYVVEWGYSKHQHHELFSKDIIYKSTKLGNIHDNPEIKISENE
jgi:uncharacterized phage protein (TIGR01671 family)